MNDTLNTIRSLRTIHGDFSEKDISEVDLSQILEASVRSANASARQSYSIIVLEDRQRMKDLFSYQGSRALVYCVDFSRIEFLAKSLGHDFNETNIIGFITASMDTILAAQTAVIAAKSLGIDSLITNGLHRNSLEKVYQLLRLPEKSCFPLMTVVLGYPCSEPAYQKGRLSLDYVVHRGEYHTPSETEIQKIISEYDDHSKHLGLTDNWEELGFNHYLDWFFVKWTGNPPIKKVADGKILEFQQRLRKSGFWWVEEGESVEP